MLVPGFIGLDTLQQGENSIVLRALRKVDGSRVVLKFPPAEYPEHRELLRFQSEYEILRALETPWVVRPLELQTWGHRPVLVLEDDGGIALNRVLEQARAPAHDAGARLRLCLQLARAVAAIHDAGVLHKDLILDNVLYHPEDRRLQLIDFGIAIHEEGRAASPGAMLEGHLTHIAPELAGMYQASVADWRCDLYAMGVSFFHLLTGRLPFVSDDPLTLLHRHLAAPPPLAHLLEPAIPEQASSLVAKLMAKTPEERYQSAHGVAADLERICKAFEDSGEVAAFELGSEDSPQRFALPQTLYGRESETGQLQQAFEASREAPSLFLVSGEPGVGKTALLRRMHPTVAACGGLFAEGKFDQFQRGTPFSALGQAFQDILRQVQGRGAQELQRLTQRLRQVLGPNGRIIIDMAPEYTKLLGELPELPPLGAVESMNRFNLALNAFLDACSTPHSPLVLFLDDLQWADLPSLQLLERLAGTRKKGGLLLLGAYREQEVTQEHPLAQTRRRLQEQGRCAGHVLLQPLSLESMCSLVADALALGEQGARAPLARELGGALLHRTAGNPFFVHSYLLHLHDKGIIFRPPGSRAWSCDIELVRQLEAAENVGVLMADSLGELPEQAQRLLQLAGFLGNEFDTDTLALLAGESEERTRTALTPALRMGLLLPRAGSIQGGPVTRTVQQPLLRLRFMHDRVQQAAYDLAPRHERPALHLHIGRLLQQGADSDQRLFEVANHIHLGRACLEKREELLELAGLHRAAGLRARDAAAFETSLDCLRKAWAVLPQDVWQQERDLAFDLYVEQAKALSWTGRHQEAEEQVARGLELARTPLERAELMVILINQATLERDLPKAIHRGMEALGMLGMVIPDSEKARQRRAMSLYRELRERLLATPWQQIMALPELSGLEERAMVSLVAELAGPASVVDSSLWALLVLEVLRLALQQGHMPESLGAYLCMARMTIVEERDYENAIRIIELVRRLMQQFPSRYWDAVYESMMAFQVAPWMMPMREALFDADKAGKQAMESGAFVYACFARTICSSRILLTSPTLQEALADLDAEVASVQATEMIYGLDFAKGLRLVARSLAGKDESPDPAKVHTPEDRELLQRIESSEDMLLQIGFETFRGYALVLHGHLQQALELLQGSSAKAGQYFGVCFISLRIFLEGLLLARLDPAGLDAATAEKRKDTLEHLDILAEIQPSNYRGMRCLARAEEARSEGRALEASDLYGQAVEAAKEGDFIHLQALACELAGLFWQARNNAMVARNYLREARYLYAMWGAKRKVALMDSKHAMLLAATGSKELRGAGGEAHLPLDLEQTSVLDRTSIDLAALLKSARSISEEIEFEQLLPRLMPIMCEHAGAQRGLYLERQGEAYAPLALFADGTRGGEGEAFTVRLLQKQEGREIAWHEGLVRQAAAQRRPVLLEELGERGNAERTAAALALPIMRKENVFAVLYFENDLVPAAFPPAIFPALQALAAQAAFSLENARLYSGLQQAERRYRSIFENSVAGIFQSTPEGRIVVVNPAAASLLGYDSTEEFTAAMQSLEHDFYMDPADRQRFLELLQQGQVKNYEVQARSKSGAPIWVSINARASHDSEGRMTIIEGFFEDISRRKEDEARIRLLGQELLRAQEAERLRLSRELHDNLAQILLAGKLQVHLLGVTDGERRQQAAEKLDSLLQASIDSVRQLSHLLRPPNFEHLGLERALKVMCQEMSEGAGISPECKLAGLDALELDDEDSINIYRLVQEGLQNIVKHAAASKVVLSVAHDGGVLRLRLRDDGKGFDVNARLQEVLGTRHFGLLGMQERARLLGGELQIHSAPEGGTEIELEVLLKRRRPA